MNGYSPMGNTLFPPVVKNLLIINAILFFATSMFMSSFGIDLTEHLALFYFTSSKFRIWQLFTHLFMHASLMHLFSNMFALWMFGSILENFLGAKKFLNYYILTGIGASILFMGVQFFEISPLQKNADQYISNPTIGQFNAFIQDDVPEKIQADFMQVLSFWESHPNNLEAKSASVGMVKAYVENKVDTATLGASGAVFGILLAFGMLFPNTLIYIYFFFPMKAKYLVILYGLFELYSGVANNPTDNVAHFAHLGGMLIGFILIKVWNIKRPDQFF